MNFAPNLYHAHMVNAKQRFLAIDRVLGAKKPRTVSVDLDNDFCWLQLRNIVELVAFSCIISDEKRYAALRAETTKNPDYKRDGKAGKIFDNLSLINPHFLPTPIQPVPETTTEGLLHFKEGGAVQTLDRFVNIFQTAGQYLHTPNPFEPENLFEYGQMLVDSRTRIKVELAYLKGVLWHHAKVGLAFDGGDPRQFTDHETAWIINFGKADSFEISMTLATAKH